MPTRSSALFSTGVPVKAQLRRRDRPRTTSLVVLPRFLIRCDSSSTTRSKAIGRPSSPPCEDFAVADHDLIIGDPQRHVRQPPLPGPPGLIAFDRQGRHFGRPEMELALPVRHQRLGADHQYAADLAATEQEADRRDRLHALSQPHFVGQDRRMPRIEERHALELKGKRRAAAWPTRDRTSRASNGGCRR